MLHSRKGAVICNNHANIAPPILIQQTKTERIIRKIVFNLPKWAQVKNHMKMAPYRPVVAFLPTPPNRATIKLLPQKPSRRYMREQAARAKEETELAKADSPVVVAI